MNDRQKQIVPVDIRRIRQTLDLTMKQMGEQIAIYSQGVPYSPVPETRVSEWEFRHRHIPSYVFTASAKLLLDHWSEDRHMALPARQLDVDVFYGSALNPAFGHMFKLEKEMLKGSSRNHKVLSWLREARVMQQRYLERLLAVRMFYVFAHDMGVDVTADKEKGI
ncbi:hypothetical protein [Geomonas azotofigens]|uniref:hypothetical protein n=1 Tax=Geomonas azotofigens TaxID=2843196 RepID=UPI001C10F724|nr:hypothetical protein [Geomonas azotofigens]MBU5612889.1 hypothetical protein [Geomonas azotofigens]